MTMSLMNRFAQSGYEPVVHNGRLVHPMLRLPVTAGDTVEIEWVSAASPRVQGLALRLRNPHVRGAEGYAGSIAVADSSSPSVMLWMDSAPSVVQVSIERVDDGGELRISNRWRQPDGREDEWLNNYGILIEEEEEDRCFLLRCSDGVGKQPTFDDLVVRVRWRST